MPTYTGEFSSAVLRRRCFQALLVVKRDRIFPHFLITRSLLRGKSSKAISTESQTLPNVYRKLPQVCGHPPQNCSVSGIRIFKSLRLAADLQTFTKHLQKISAELQILPNMNGKFPQIFRHLPNIYRKLPHIYKQSLQNCRQFPRRPYIYFQIQMCRQQPGDFYLCYAQ